MAIVDLKKFKISSVADAKSRNTLKAGDIVRRQYFDGRDSIYTVMYVESVGEDKVVENGESKVSSYFIGLLLYGDEPKSGEILDFVRVTSLSDPHRSGALYLTSSDNSSPYMDIVDGFTRENAVFCPDKVGSGGYQPIYAGTSIDFLKSDSERYRIAKFTNSGSSNKLGMSVKSDTMRNDDVWLVSFKAKANKSTDCNFVVKSSKGTDANKTYEVTSTIKQFFIPVTTNDIDLAGREVELSFDGLGIKDDYVEISDFVIVQLSTITKLSGVTKVRVGLLDGIYDSGFGQLDGYGGYFQKLFATKDVNVSGTITAGDKDGSGATFYAGKIHKNLFKNSLGVTFTENDALEVSYTSPVGIGNVFTTTKEQTTLIGQSEEWCNKNEHKEVCFSLYVKTDEDKDVTIQSNHDEIFIQKIFKADGWTRVYFSFFIKRNRDVKISLMNKDVFFTAPQMEYGDKPSLYQATDNTLNYTDEYGAWMSRGGFGGTIQNPLLKLGEDGSIESKGSGFRIDNDGTGHLAGGAIKFDKEKVNISFENSNIGGEIQGVEDRLDSKIKDVETNFEIKEGQISSSVKEVREKSEQISSLGNQIKTVGEQASKDALLAKDKAELAQAEADRASSIKTSIVELETSVTQTADEIALTATEVQTNANQVSSKHTEVIQNANKVSLQAQDIENNKTLIEQTAEKVSSDAKDVAGNKTLIEQTAEKVNINAQKAIESANKAIEAEASINLKADGIVMEASQKSAQKAIDGLEIGGRNLLKGGGNPSKGSGSSGVKTELMSDGTVKITVGRAGDLFHSMYVTEGVHRFLEDDLSDGDNVVISAWFRVDEGVKTPPNVYIRSEMSYVKMIGSITDRFSQVWAIRRYAKNKNNYFNMHFSFREPGVYYFKCTKIEKGNKPTDWTPAPEDIDAQFTETNSNLSILSDKIVANTTSIEQTEKRLKTAETTISQQGDQIALKASKKEVDKVTQDVKDNKALIDVNSQGITLAQNSVKEVKDDLDNLKIGGRNYLYGWKTGSWKEPKLYNISNCFLEFGSEYPLEVGEKYVFSVFVQVLDEHGLGSSNLGLGKKPLIFHTDYYYKVTQSRQVIDVDLKIYRYIYHINFDKPVWDNEKHYFAYRVRRFNKPTQISSNVWGAKLEKGTKPTDWSPAPEDIDSKFEETEARIDITDGKIDSNTKLINESNKRLSTAETKILQHEDKISLTASKTELDKLTGDVVKNTSAINQNSKGIELSVKSNKELKEELDNLEIGGRNLVKNTKTTAFPPTYHIGGTTSIIDDATIAQGWKWRRDNFSITGSAPSLYFNFYLPTYYTENFVGEKVTVSFYMRGDVPFTFDGQSIGTEWTKYSRTRTWHSSANWHPIFRDASTLTWYEMHSLKIEKGNKPTDWSPAPEDTEAQITELESNLTQTNNEIKGLVKKTDYDANNKAVSKQISEISQKSDKISLQVTEQGKKITGVDDRVKKTEIALEPDNIWLSVKDNTKKAIDNLEIGGRNLLTDEKRQTIYKENGTLGTLTINHAQCPHGFYMVNDSSNSQYFRIDNLFKTSGVYTLSFEFRGSQGSIAYTQVFIGDKKSPIFRGNNQNDWLKFSFTATIEDLDNNNYIKFYPGWIYAFFRNIKLEKGNKPTDWSPAPEDIDSKFEETEARIDITDGKIDSNTKLINESNKRLSTAETKILQHEDKISLTASKTELDKLTGDVVKNTSAINQNSKGIELSVKSNKELKEELDGLEIGGRNYFSLTHLNSLSPSSWTVRAYLYEFELEPNTEYILSSNLPVGQNSLYFNGSGAEDRMVDKNQYLSRTTDSEGKFFIAVPTGRSNTSDILNGTYWVKLEKGTKPTDWSPAPEDIDAQFAENEARIDIIDGKIDSNTKLINESNKRLSTAETKILQHEDKISLTASKTELDKLTGDVVKNTSAINQNSKGIELSVKSNKELKEELDSLEIGGRNYILESLVATHYNFTTGFDSKGKWFQFNINVRTITNLDVFEAETSYVLSFEYVAVDGSGAIPYFRIRYTDGTFSPYLANRHSPYVTNANKTVRTVETTYNTPGVVRVYNLKFEKGNKPTDWTPAPEDTFAEIQILKDSITSTVSSIDKLDTRISKVTQESDKFQVEITKKIGDDINANNEKILSSFTVSDNTISMLGKDISLTGKISFNSLDLSTKSKINNALSDSSKALSDVREVDGKIINRNYVYQKTETDYNTLDFYLSNDFPRTGDHKVTLSIWGDFSGYQNEEPYDEISFQGDYDSFIFPYKYKWKSDNHIVYEGGTLNLNGDPDPNILVVLGMYKGTDIEVRAVKLEMGDKATPWIPSPEDTIGLAKLDETIIEGGYLRTSLIEAKSLTAEKIDVESLFANRIRTGNLDVLEGATIGGFEVNGYNLRNIDNNDCWISISCNDSYSTRLSSLGNNIPSVSGIAVAGYFSATGRGRNIALALNASGSVNNVATFGGKENLAINAVGGCNWKMAAGDHWCMPGLLGVIEFTCSFSNNTYYHGAKLVWGNGISRDVKSVLHIQDLLIDISINIGHTDYYVIVQATSNGLRAEKWGLVGAIEGFRPESFTVSFWAENKKHIPKKAHLFIFGTPKD